MDIFDPVLSYKQPSVTIAEIKKHEALKKKFDADRDSLGSLSGRNPIGFKLSNNKNE